MHKVETLIRFLEWKINHLKFRNDEKDKKRQERISKWNNKLLDLEDELEKMIDKEMKLAVTPNEVQK